MSDKKTVGQVYYNAGAPPDGGIARDENAVSRAALIMLPEKEAENNK